MSHSRNHQKRLYADTVEPIARENSEEVFFLSIEAFPDPDSADFSGSGGTYVHCYVDAETLEAAEHRALSLLRAAGWRPHCLEGWEITSPAAADRTIDEVHDLSQFELVKHALAEGVAMIFYPSDYPHIDTTAVEGADSGHSA